jgi:hypothetical protein
MGHVGGGSMMLENNRQAFIPFPAVGDGDAIRVGQFENPE